MKTITLLSTALALLISSSPVARAADFKVGIVDMTRVFAEYYKSKDAEDKIETQKEMAKKELDEKREKYKELIDKYQAFGPKIKDPAISQELRKKLTKEAETLGGEIRSLERQNAEEIQRREGQLQEEASRLRKSIMEEISKAVEEHGRVQNYDIVFDKSGLSTRGIPFLLFTKDATDFSADIIEKLNKGA